MYDSDGLRHLGNFAADTWQFRRYAGKISSHPSATSQHMEVDAAPRFYM